MTAPGNSRRVVSSQRHPHQRLEQRRLRQSRGRYRRPLRPGSRQALEAALRFCAGRPAVLDAGCGTGESSAGLARRYPGHPVLGVDRSARRLAGSGAGMPDNLLLLRADLQDLYPLAASAGLRLARHYLLYPNPWPRPAQLGRRWHGHPVFPSLLALGGHLELRTNWDVYALEFAAALRQQGVPADLAALEPGPALTPFERKYRASGHALYRVRADLEDREMAVPMRTGEPG